MQPSTVNKTELGAQEWRDTLFLRYGLEPPDLPTHCDGCQTKFLISYALDCWEPRSYKHVDWNEQQRPNVN